MSNHTHLDTTGTEGIRHAMVATRIGTLLVVADAAVVTGIYFPQHTYPPAVIGRPSTEADDALLGEAAIQLREYLAGERECFDLPIGTNGDPFSERVWAILREIPYGQTTSYGAIAEQLGSKSLAQRVGQAVGHNPLSIVIPCHRVVGADGSLTGFAGGLPRKRALLDLEEPAEVSAERLF